MVSFVGLVFVGHDFLLITVHSRSSFSFKMVRTFSHFFIQLNGTLALVPSCSLVTFQFVNFVMAFYHSSNSFAITPANDKWSVELTGGPRKVVSVLYIFGFLQNSTSIKKGLYICIL